MKDKIGLEEHFALEGTLGDSRNFVGPETWRDLRARLLDVQDIRLREMDDGIEMMLLFVEQSCRSGGYGSEGCGGGCAPRK